MSETRATYSGRVRRHGTKWSVRVSDVIARWVITIGGLGTIASVLTVFAFLAWVVWPLFLPGSVTADGDSEVPWNEPPLEWSVNDQRTLVWSVSSQGQLRVVAARDGVQLPPQEFGSDGELSSVSRSVSSSVVLFGTHDGAVRISTISGVSTVVERSELPESLRDLSPGLEASYENRLLRHSDSGVFQWQSIEAIDGDRIDVGKDRIERVDHLERSAPEELTGPGPLVLAWERGGILHALSTRKDELSGGLRVSEKGQVRLARDEAPLAIQLMARGESALLVYADGRVVRYDLSNLDKIAELESHRVVEGDARVTVAGMMLGRETLVVGDNRGRVTAWFLTRKMHAANRATEHAGALQLTLAHTLVEGGSGITALSTSARSRTVAIGSTDGHVRLIYVTTEQPVVEFVAASGQPVKALRIAPRDDGLMVVAEGRLKNYRLQLGHPEASFAGFFTAVWYEGYTEPRHIWQSSFAGVEPEIKLGLWPLIFGTLKATLYAMIFGAPLALLAAVYTSEFASPSARIRIKPAIEMMASLPSVVLGFLAALVLAPVLETMLPAVLASFIVLPLTFVIAAEFWQILPTSVLVRLDRLRLVLLVISLGLGIVATSLLANPVEQWLFAGDIMLWLDRQRGSGIGASLFLLLPLSLLLIAFVNSVWVNRWLLRTFPRISRTAFAVLNAAKVGLEIGLAIAVATALAIVFDLLGIDLRGSLVDTYVQRNALIVGFAVGFAVIPLIFTIAEDALATVPQHLRSASLGAGATPWQTAIRVVIPTAMSGLFSAVMIGLGRAVGETMIILMAAGNTPLTSLNPFSGCRTLSANIAVELPEAVRDSTHYRTLFFAGFVLFVLTFLVNTTAEVIRLRFRRRAYQL